MTNYSIDIVRIRSDEDIHAGPCCLCQTEPATMLITTRDPWCDGECNLPICACCAQNFQSDIQLELDK